MTTTIDRRPTRIDWKFARGDTWLFDFQLNVATESSPTTGEPLDLTGSTWLMHVRADGPDGTLFATATVDDSGQSSGAITAKVEEGVTEGAAAGKKVYYYDLEQTLDSDVSTPVGGYITVDADSSRD